MKTPPTLSYDARRCANLAGIARKNGISETQFILTIYDHMFGPVAHYSLNSAAQNLALVRNHTLRTAEALRLIWIHYPSKKRKFQLAERYRIAKAQRLLHVRRSANHARAAILGIAI